MKPTLQTFVDPKAFREVVYPLLLQNEAQNCVCIGIIDTLITDPNRYSEYALASLVQAGRVVGAAWMTPPHPLGMTGMPESAMPELVNFAAIQKSRPTGILGPMATLETFKEQWLGATGCRIKSKRALRIFELTQVNPLPQSPGAMRIAEEDDLALLAQWHHCFDRECGVGDDPKMARENAARAIKNRSRFVWQVDGQVVAMAGVGGPTPNGIRIIAVYTRPEARGKGYASTLVAMLSQMQLNQGKRFCFLYTDLANPVSNSIYQRIGYKAVCDSAHYIFQY